MRSTPRPITRRIAWATVVAWLLLLGALAALAPSLASVKEDAGDKPPADSMSMRAAAASSGDDTPPPAIVVVASDSPSTTRSAAAAVADAIRAAQLPGVAAVADSTATPGLVSADGTGEMLVVRMQGSDFKDSVTRLRAIAAADDHGARIAVTGPAGIATDAVKVFGGSDKVLLLGTITLVVVLLFGIYRSPVLVAVSLVGVGFAMRLAEGVGALLADLSWITISSQTASIMTVLLFGVGTDYALIVFARFREALAHHPDPRVAMGEAIREVAGALAASVSTIVAAVLVLLAAITPVLHDFGPYLAIGVASMAAVAFTLTPALLVICGRFAFWPRRPVVGEVPESRLWGRVADLVIAAPRRILAGGIVAMLVMSAGLIGVQQNFDLLSGFRIPTDSATGQKLLAEKFGPGAIAPTRVLVTSPTEPTPDQVGALTHALGSISGVERIGSVRVGPTTAIDVVLTENPYGKDALDLMPTVQKVAQDATESTGITDAEVLVGGETATAADTRAALDRDLLVVGLLMLVAVAAILGIVLRSVLAPVYLAATLLLSYAATMGVTVALTGLLGDDGLGNRVAVYVLVLLVALGVDYTIFMMTRFRQELRFSDPVTALRSSIVRTGGVISSAGVILAGTFAVLMTQPIRELFQFGLAMAIGILLDTFVVRPLLVPAMIRLLGRNALWPSPINERGPQ